MKDSLEAWRCYAHLLNWWACTTARTTTDKPRVTANKYAMCVLNVNSLSAILKIKKGFACTTKLVALWVLFTLVASFYPLHIKHRLMQTNT